MAIYRKTGRIPLSPGSIENEMPEIKGDDIYTIGLTRYWNSEYNSRPVGENHPYDPSWTPVRGPKSTEERIPVLKIKYAKK